MVLPFELIYEYCCNDLSWDMWVARGYDLLSVHPEISVRALSNGRRAKGDGDGEAFFV